MTHKITLRQKDISKGRRSLYLDIYPPIPHPETGKQTRREFLGLYLYIDKAELKKEISALKKQNKPYSRLESLYKELKSLSPIDKTHNIETLKIAENIRQKRENYYNKPEIYSQYEKEQLRIKELGERSFIDYFRKLAEKRHDTNYSNWLAALNYLIDFTGGELKFAELNEFLLNEFKEYLLNAKSKRSEKTKLSQNSAVSYFNKVKAALRQAFKDGILQTDLNGKIEPIKEEETRREYLTLEEVNQLVKTPCDNPILKRAALFSALTGLRHVDIRKMTWGELEYIEGQGYFLNFAQQKTKGIEYLPISDQAYSFTEGTENPKDMPQDKKVFEGLKYSAYTNKHSLSPWIKAAGITKYITFHCFRHTFATLQLFNGTDIYTLSGMLGHKGLKNTQVYAKIVDESKRKAANRIKLDL